jgi:Tetratricopeptide repeat
LTGVVKAAFMAEPLYQQALAIYEHTLGTDHPNTITIRENYAKFLREAYR